jgi:hypothetical protein
MQHLSEFMGIKVGEHILRFPLSHTLQFLKMKSERVPRSDST